MMFRAWLKSRIFAASVVAALALFASGRAHAQLLGTGGTTITTGTGGNTGTSTFSASDFFVGVQQTQGVNLSAFDVARFFNQAHCNCSTPVYLFIAIQPQSVGKRTTVTNVQGNISVVLGNGCSTLVNESIVNCVVLAQEPTLTFLNDTSYTIKTDARTLSTYPEPDSCITTFDAGATSIDGGTSVTGTSTGACSATGQFDQAINVLIDFNGDNSPDVSGGLSSSLLIDLSPPPPPTNVTIQGGDEALIMKWTDVDTSLTTDLLGYQILCSRADQYQVFKENEHRRWRDRPFQRRLRGLSFDPGRNGRRRLGSHLRLFAAPVRGVGFLSGRDPAEPDHLRRRGGRRRQQRERQRPHRRLRHADQDAELL